MGLKTLIISDLHIGSKGCQTEEILNLLSDDSYKRYILIGDIIDGWLFTKYKKFSYEHTRVIRRLLKLSKNKEIIWAPPIMSILFTLLRHLPRPIWRKISAG